MRILYFDWDEFNGEDCRDAMTRLGYQVDVVKGRKPDGSLKPILESDLREWMVKTDDNGNRFYNCVFSFDYFPEVSETCQKYSMPYVSWVFDCPHYPLYSRTLSNEVNHVNIFDKGLCEELKARGAITVRHTLLGVNAERLKVILGHDGNNDCTKYFHDVAFLGNLYDNEFNFYDKAPIPSEITWYLDDVFEAQQKIYGRDIFSDKRVIDEDILGTLRECIHFEDTGKFNVDYDRVLLDILRKKVTVIERRKMLQELGSRYNTVMYTTPDAAPIKGVENMGLADYYTQMPQIFKGSKVNINMTLRCIPSGVPLRVMDILGAGGFLITSYTEEIAEYFEDGKDLVIAYTPEEMVEKVGYYLEHEEERRVIARQGQKKVFEEYSYGKILPEILKFL